MNYGIEMKKIRDINRISQKEAASILNIARSTYNQYEQQYDIIPLKHLNNFCNYFNVSFDYMFNLTLEKRYIDEIEKISIQVSSKRIKELRKSLNLTQKSLAKELNIATSMLCEYEKGHFLISTATLYSLSKNDHISSDYLLGKTNKIKNLKTIKDKELMPN